jgi:hypothetical protein
LLQEFTVSNLTLFFFLSFSQIATSVASASSQVGKHNRPAMVQKKFEREGGAASASAVASVSKDGPAMEQMMKFEREGGAASASAVASASKMLLVTTGCVNKYSHSNACCSGDIVISTTVTHLANAAFYACTEITSVTIPTTVVLIGNQAFQYNLKLSSIVFPTSVIRLGTRVVFQCVDLSSVLLPTSLTFIDEEAFGAAETYEPCKAGGSATLYVPASLAASVYAGAQFHCAVVTYIDGEKDLCHVFQQLPLFPTLSSMS